MASVLVIEDNSEQKIPRCSLEQAGYEVRVAATWREGLLLARTERPDIILLDVMLPDLPGASACKVLMEEATAARIPTIIVSSRGQEMDRIAGLELGADDYVVKPFSTRELLLRMGAAMRRTHPSSPPSSISTYGLLRVDREAHRTWVGASEVDLTALQFRLLLVLCERQGRVQSRDELFASVWTDREKGGESRSVDTLVKRLRVRLCAAGKYIKTVRGWGYRFSSEPG
jgi:two-component system phosphate regulon response regulator PhoB